MSAAHVLTREDLAALAVLEGHAVSPHVLHASAGVLRVLRPYVRAGLTWGGTFGELLELVRDVCCAGRRAVRAALDVLADAGAIALRAGRSGLRIEPAAALQSPRAEVASSSAPTVPGDGVPLSPVPRARSSSLEELVDAKAAELLAEPVDVRAALERAYREAEAFYREKGKPVRSPEALRAHVLRDLDAALVTDARADRTRADRVAAEKAAAAEEEREADLRRAEALEELSRAAAESRARREAAAESPYGIRGGALVTPFGPITFPTVGRS